MPAGAFDAEADLWNGLMNGDAQAWHAFIERYERLVWHIVRSSDIRSQDAEDVVQVTFLRIAERLPTLRDPEKLTSFVAGVARLTTMESARRNWKRRSAEWQLDDAFDSLPSSEPLPEQAAIDNALVASAVHGLRFLGRDCRELLRLVLGTGLRTAEIALALGVEQGTIRVRKHRCLQQLRATPTVAAMLAQHGSDDDR